MDGATLQQILGSAEHAALSGDYESAEALLREAARLQESTLGRHHPDVASTFNNLAVVCEKSNNLAAAEEYYERAFSIAAASLGAEHPLVTTSRNNLDEFRRAHGRLTDETGETDGEGWKGERGGEDEKGRTEPPTGEAVVLDDANHGVIAGADGMKVLVRGVAAIVVLSVIALGVWLMRTPSRQADADAQAALPVATQEFTSATKGKNIPAKPRTASTDRARTTTSVAKQPSQGPRIIEASLCQNLSTGARWQCTPASESASAGMLFFYTRIAASQSTKVHHRWYRNGRLLQDVPLVIAANPSTGYRTYTRRRVDEGEWRVELVTGDGVILHKETVPIR